MDQYCEASNYNNGPAVLGSQDSRWQAAQMKPELLLEITATFGENGHLNKARYPNYGHCR